VIEESPIINSLTTISNEVSPPAPPPGSDRKTRGFRVHIEPRTHTVTRTNKKGKCPSIVTIKQELIEIKNSTCEISSLTKG
jgi:hypothetical protein